MTLVLGIRREDKNKWEKRVPIIPEHVKQLKEKHGIQTIIQPSNIRAYSDEQFEKAGAIISEDLSNCDTIFAVKEIPKHLFESNKTYVFFSHVIKGQSYNMPMLKDMMNKECNLIEYEKIVDENNKRLIFFGRHAGLAGMVESLWTYGQRLLKQNQLNTPLSEIKHAYEYRDLEEIKEHLNLIGDKIKQNSLPEEITPLIVGFAGYGNVSLGAQEILDIFPCKEIEPDEIKDVFKNHSNNIIYKVIFKEDNIVKPVDENKTFELLDYYKNPDKYESQFEQYVPNLTILMNCIYWDERYPRLITKEFLKENINNEGFKLSVVGDISVDINGSIQATMKETDPGNPSYTYNPEIDIITDGVKGKGITIMAVDNLPCEMPKESSSEFSNALLPFIKQIIECDYTESFDQLKLPNEIKNALILHKGKLTSLYNYINNYL